MELYAGIDLHSNNSVVTVLDEKDRTVYARRLPNNLDAIVSALRACAGSVRGVAVESTYNWYWLVDGLQAAGFTVHLVNTAAVKQYDGLKLGGDFSDLKATTSTTTRAKRKRRSSAARWAEAIDTARPR